MSDFECPYCGYEIDEPDTTDYHEEGVVYEYDCENCDKNFVFTISYLIHYQTDKAPCLNGQSHVWEKIVGYPEEFYKNEYRCKYCSKENTFSKAPVAQGGGDGE